MNTPLLLGVALSGAAAIAADSGVARHRAFYLLKPLTTLLVLLLCALAPPGDYRLLLLLALVWALLGDVLLMLRGERMFAAGAGSFLVAHLLFVAAFVQAVPPGVDGVRTLAVPAWALLPLLYGLLFFGLLLWRTHGRHAALIGVYGLALVAMTVAACVQAHTLDRPAAWLALYGAGLFVLSDSALALRQFLRPYRGAQALILSTYWAGLSLIALSAH
jgi:alkenylglycerophosphocholine hydrolase